MGGRLDLTLYTKFYSRYIVELHLEDTTLKYLKDNTNMLMNVEEENTS